jgi:DNA-binding NtrC family response regulator
MVDPVGSAAGCELLLVDDDAELRSQMAENLQRLGYRVTAVGTVSAAVELRKAQEFSVAIVDLMLPDGSGIDLLDRWQALEQDDCAIVMLSGRGTIATAVEAMKHGAADFLTKPVRLMELDAALKKVLERRRLARENQQLKRLLQQQKPPSPLVGSSPALQHLWELIRKVAPTPQPVLIQGESGTGKELVARALVEHSHLHDRPYVTINCAALPETLLESELFGHEKGAFTGAQGVKPGLFEVADGGTLLIDEVGELALPLQAKLLRVLEDGSMRRVGSVKQRRVQVRLLAATNRDLAAEVQAGRFREDLYYRINVLTLTLPPLRDRGADLAELVQHFAGPNWSWDEDLPRQLQKYRWPGNVRQLRNAVERAKILGTNRLLELIHFPPEVVAVCTATTSPSDSIAIGASTRSDVAWPNSSGSFGSIESQESSRPNNPVVTGTASIDAAAPMVGASDLEQANRQHILAAYRQANGNKVHAAKALGVTRRTLYRLLEKYGIE